jgi:hypothetical protein
MVLAENTLGNVKKPHQNIDIQKHGYKMCLLDKYVWAAGIVDEYSARSDYQHSRYEKHRDIFGS